MNPDLFPETLLVEVSDGRIFTTSLKVAKHFHKPHDKVVKAIRRIIEQSPRVDSLANFGERKSLYTTGRKQARERAYYEMTEEGFAIVAMSFTGEKALRWKWDFLNAFFDVREQLAAIKERESAALYTIRPRWKPIVEHPDYRRADLIELTGHKSPGSITACRRRMRAVGLLDGRAA
jgi:Rha family phage regulatory protein